MFCVSHLWLKMIVSGCDVQENHLGVLLVIMLVMIILYRLARGNHFISRHLCVGPARLIFPFSFCECLVGSQFSFFARHWVTREVRSGCVAVSLAECLVLWFCVSLLCDRHRPSCVHPYRVGVPVVGRTVFRLPINQSISPAYSPTLVPRLRCEQQNTATRLDHNKM